MSPETWIAFVAASIAVPAIPGRTPMRVIGPSLGGWRGRAPPSAACAVAHPGVRCALWRLGGGVLIGAGIAAAAMRRA